MNNGYQHRLNKLKNHHRLNLQQDGELLKRINAGRNRLNILPLSLDLSISNIYLNPGQAIIDALHKGRRKNQAIY